MSDTYHWGSDPYWIEALDHYVSVRNSGATVLRLDVKELDKAIFTEDVSYRLAKAMASVVEHEGWDGHRGAPRLVMALMAKLIELGIATSERP